MGIKAVGSMNAADRMTTVDAIKEMLAGWNKIMAEAKAQFPKATEEDLYEITKGAMNHALAIK